MTGQTAAIHLYRSLALCSMLFDITIYTWAEVSILVDGLCIHAVHV
jgi:hypothetical protein